MSGHCLSPSCQAHLCESPSKAPSLQGGGRRLFLNRSYVCGNQGELPRGGVPEEDRVSPPGESFLWQREWLSQMGFQARGLHKAILWPVTSQPQWPCLVNGGDDGRVVDGRVV